MSKIYANIFKASNLVGSVREVFGRRRFSVEMLSNSVRSGINDARYFFFPLMTELGYYISHILKYFLHWNCCIEDNTNIFNSSNLIGSIARKLRFHILNSWNWTAASHESCVFIYHGCHLSVRICTFSGKRRCGCGEK